MSEVASFFRGTWTIALYTWREGMRKKIIVAFLILSILSIVGSFFLTAFLSQTTGSGMEVDMQAKQIKDIGVAVISIFGVLITIFISASVVPNEVENKVVYTVLSKPVRRFQYLLGKFTGAQLIIILNLVIMGGLFFIAVYMKENIMPTLLLWSVLLTYFEFLIVSAFTFALSCAATSAVLPTIGGLFIYVTGNLTEYLKDVSERAGQTELWLDKMTGQISKALFYILPNLQNFSLRHQIIHLAPNDPPRDILLPNLIVYGLSFALAGYLISYVVFFRKEL